MGRAFILNSASKAGTTGGVFADTLVANTGDSLSVVNFQNGGARITEAWGIDTTSVAEFSYVYTRPLATHDQQRGVRFNVPALLPGGAGNVAAHNLLSGYGLIDVYPSDTLTITATSTAADNLLTSWVTWYDDAPGIQGVFISPAQATNLQLSAVGIACNAVASATRGAYGATRAFNADDPRLHANTWYALLGWTVQTACTSITLLGPDWGGQRIGGPAGVLGLDNATWFWDQSFKWGGYFGSPATGAPLIPCFNSNNAGAINVQIADGQASTSPKIDFLLYELTQPPVSGQ
jgi:hypothetical protein